MGNVQRSKARTLPENERSRCSCSILGCPDPAVVSLPLNENVWKSQEFQWWSVYEATEPAEHPKLGYPLYLRLCRRCVRNLATQLPASMRLPGAVLRYPECDPESRSTEQLEAQHAAQIQ